MFKTKQKENLATNVPQKQVIIIIIIIIIIFPYKAHTLIVIGGDSPPS